MTTTTMTDWSFEILERMERRRDGKYGDGGPVTGTTGTSNMGIIPLPNTRSYMVAMTAVSR